MLASIAENSTGRPAAIAVFATRIADIQKCTSLGKRGK